MGGWQTQHIPPDPGTLFQVLENTPENHTDHSSLKLALERAEELCSQVNEGVREKESSDRLEWIQAHVQCEGLAEVRPPGSELAGAPGAGLPPCGPSTRQLNPMHTPPAPPRLPSSFVTKTDSILRFGGL